MEIDHEISKEIMNDFYSLYNKYLKKTKPDHFFYIMQSYLALAIMESAPTDLAGSSLISDAMNAAINVFAKEKPNE